MADYELGRDGYTALENRYAGFTVRDPSGARIGKVDDLFLDENDRPEYIGVKMGFLGTRSTLISIDACTIDEQRGFIDVSADEESVREGPSFDDDREITPEYEADARSYYGLENLNAPPGTEAGTGTGIEARNDRGAYGDYYDPDTGGESYGARYETGGYAGAITTGPETAGTVGPGMSMGDTESGEFREHDSGDEGVYQSHGSDLVDEDELRVQRSEEEMVAGTREREAGAMRIRKRVRSDRERIEVPTRREEVP